MEMSVRWGVADYGWAPPLVCLQAFPGLSLSPLCSLHSIHIAHLLRCTSPSTLSMHGGSGGGIACSETCCYKRRSTAPHPRQHRSTGGSECVPRDLFHKQRSRNLQPSTRKFKLSLCEVIIVWRPFGEHTMATTSTTGLALVVVVGAAVTLAQPSPSIISLPRLNIARQGVLTAGCSHAADFAHQFHIAFSSLVGAGACVFSGQPFHCAVQRFSGDPQVIIPRHD